jgi:hypothetical protein
LYGAGTWTPESRSEVPGKFSNVVLEIDGEDQLDNRVGNEEVLRVKEERNILRTIKRRKANWTGQILCRSCFLKHVIEGKIEVKIQVIGR